MHKDFITLALVTVGILTAAVAAEDAGDERRTLRLSAWQATPPTEEATPPGDDATAPSDDAVTNADDAAAPTDSSDPFAAVFQPVARFQDDLKEKGVLANLYINNQFQGVLKGGVDNTSRNAASLDFFLLFDLEALGLVEDSDVLLHFQSNWEAGINPYTGALGQVNDDADGSLGGHIAQLWYRLYLLDHKANLKIGYLDYQTIADRNAYANSEDKQFWHQWLDNNPLVPLNIGLGAAFTIQPTDWYTLVIGAGDAQSKPYASGFSTAFSEECWYVGYLENAFHVKLPSDRGDLPGNYRVGLVYDPRPSTVYEDSRQPRERGDDWGFYLSVDQLLYRESEDDLQGLGVFGRFGYRDPEVNAMSRFWSAGVQYLGLIPGRDEDVIGLGFAFLRSGQEYRTYVDREFTNETVYELYYAWKVSPNLVVTPDIQYVDNPGARGDVGHCVVAGVRLRLSL